MKRSAPQKRGRKKKLPIAVAVGSFAFDPWQPLLLHYLKALGVPKAKVSLLLCGETESRRLNRTFRFKDSPTDILSFPSQEGVVKKGYVGHLGDLALNVPYAWRKRGRFSNAFSGELAFLVLHGLLHLLGVHHDTPAQERKMEALMRRHFPPPDNLLAGLEKIKNKRP